MLKSKATLLLVDDDPAVVRLLTAILNQALGDQLNVEVFTDPTSACQRLDKGGVDILLTDLEMPNISGLEILRFAKKRNAVTQVLFLTGRSSHESLMYALELGAVDYVLKPVDRNELVELVGQAVARQRRWQQALADTWRNRQNPAEPVASS